MRLRRGRSLEDEQKIINVAENRVEWLHGRLGARFLSQLASKKSPRTGATQARIRSSAVDEVVPLKHHQGRLQVEIQKSKESNDGRPRRVVELNTVAVVDVL